MSFKAEGRGGIPCASTIAPTRAPAEMRGVTPRTSTISEVQPARNPSQWKCKVCHRVLYQFNTPCLAR